jgi:type II secretory pathway component GspD/PulD (secretin)
VLTAAADAAGGSGSSQEAGTINIPEAPLTDVVSTLARQANINFQFDPKVTGGVGADGKPMPQPIVSIRWENVTALQALEALLNNHNLVLVQDQKTKIARITPRDPAAPEPLVTRVIQLKYAATTNMVTIIQPTLSPRGKVLGDARSSQLVVLATEKEMEGVDALLAQLDVAPKQVLIRSASVGNLREIPKTVKGIDWTGTLAAQNISFGNGKTTGTTDTIIPGVPSSSTTTLPSGRTITTASTAPSSSITKAHDTFGRRWDRGLTRSRVFTLPQLS